MKRVRVRDVEEQESKLKRSKNGSNGLRERPKRKKIER